MRYNEKGNLVIETEEELLEDVLNVTIADVDEWYVKHDITHYEKVFEWDARFWKVAYNQSYNYGLEFYGPIECIEMEEREVTIKKWMPKETK
jgi:hypothetical protein